MDTKFEIHSHLEKKHYVEYYRYIWRRRIIWVTVYAISVLLALYLTLTSDETRWGIYGAALLLYAVWLYFRPWTVAAKHMKRETEFEGTETVNSVTKFSDAIYDESHNQTTTTCFDKIRKIHIGKYVILLEDARKACYILDKNGFVKGDLWGFLAYIQEKCPQLNLPKW